ncbi:MAG: hypothetical protein ACI9UK_000221 [Candidatus Krumholzibacteriia bacterium]|jgi:hypothetical protein
MTGLIEPAHPTAFWLWPLWKMDAVWGIVIVD